MTVNGKCVKHHKWMANCGDCQESHKIHKN